MDLQMATHRELSTALICVTLIAVSAFLPLRADAQTQEPSRSLLTPPTNHESGRVEEIITAADDGYRSREYALAWRSTRIVVAGIPDGTHVPGDNLDIVVYRTDVDGHKVLRFAENASASNETLVDPDSASPVASVTLAKARIEETVSSESEGYRFVGYFVTWHDKRVFVVDTQSAPIRAVGETINFRVLRSGSGADKRLSFSL
jgi:hypothetical protein